MSGCTSCSLGGPGEVTGDAADAGVYIFSTSWSAYAGGEATLTQ